MAAQNEKLERLQNVTTQAVLKVGPNGIYRLLKGKYKDAITDIKPEVCD